MITISEIIGVIEYIVFCVSASILIVMFLETTKISKNAHYFGFNCYGCEGKTNPDGTIYFRCKIKPYIVRFLMWIKVM